MAFFSPTPTPTGALHAAATDRNREPILNVLSRVLPATGLVLEIASGTGQHAAFFAKALPRITWQPTDLLPAHLDSIAVWARDASAPNLLSPLPLDVCAQAWPVASATAVVNINMIHIAPFAACEALMRGAGRLLAAGGVLFLYGPFKQGGQHTADSNVAFDARLRAENAAWGVRDAADVAAAAGAAGFSLIETVPMPANNLSLVFRKTGLTNAPPAI